MSSPSCLRVVAPFIAAGGERINYLYLGLGEDVLDTLAPTRALVLARSEDDGAT